MKTPKRFRSVGEIKREPIDDKKSFRFFLPGAITQRMAHEAFVRGTTVSEILRTLAESWINAIDGDTA